MQIVHFYTLNYTSAKSNKREQHIRNIDVSEDFQLKMAAFPMCPPMSNYINIVTTWTRIFHNWEDKSLAYRYLKFPNYILCYLLQKYQTPNHFLFSKKRHLKRALFFFGNYVSGGDWGGGEATKPLQLVLDPAGS